MSEPDLADDPSMNHLPVFADLQSAYHATLFVAGWFILSHISRREVIYGDKE